MADFCSKRISTVTGQVSLMPQAAVICSIIKIKMFSEHCFWETQTAGHRQKQGKIILSNSQVQVDCFFSSKLTGVIVGQANMYPWCGLLKRHTMIFCWILCDHWLWFCVSEPAHQKYCLLLKPYHFPKITVFCGLLSLRRVSQVNLQL